MLYKYEALSRSHCRAIEFFRKKKDVAFFASQNEETHKYYKRTSVRVLRFLWFMHIGRSPKVLLAVLKEVAL